MLFEIPTYHDERGTLAVLEGNRLIPFEIKRLYYLCDLSSDSRRGCHAHRNLRQVMIALAGKFDVLLDDGMTRRVHHLDRPNLGLLIDRMVWREIYNFNPGSICLVVASDYYDESDYLRTYEEFLVRIKQETQG
jgi:hypothetical protein